MTFRLLEIFLAVRRWGSMTAAARDLDMAQPPVSQAIADLERELGVPLFERRGRGIAPTPEGLRFEAYAAHIVRLAAEAQSSLRTMAASGDLKMGASKTVAVDFLPGVLRRYRPLRPGARFEVHVDNTASVLEKLSTARLDVALVEGRVEGPGLWSERLCTDELVLLCSPRHPWAGQPRVDVKALAGEGFLLREPGSGTRETFVAAMAERDLDWWCAGEVADTEALVALVAEGLGCAFLSGPSVRAAIHQGHVVPIAVSGFALKRDFRLVIHEAKWMSPSLVEFSDCAREAGREYRSLGR